jgi:hypothetical protein
VPQNPQRPVRAVSGFFWLRLINPFIDEFLNLYAIIPLEQYGVAVEENIE